MKSAPKSVAKVVVLENNDPIFAETEAIKSRIRQRAFELSQVRPRDASELYDWMAAEAEIISVPRVKLIEKEGIFELKFALAGVNPEEVNVMVTPDRILIKSEYTEQPESGEGTVHFSDFKSSTVFRSVNLPERIDTTRVKVDFEDGLLRVTVAKEGAPARKAPAKKSRAKQ